MLLSSILELLELQHRVACKTIVVNSRGLATLREVQIIFLEKSTSLTQETM